jgi:hypothetical protein
MRGHFRFLPRSQHRSHWEHMVSNLGCNRNFEELALQQVEALWFLASCEQLVAQ